MDWEKDRDRLRGREAENKERLSIILLILLLSTIMYVNIFTVGFWVVHFMFRRISLRGVWEWGEDLFPLHCFSLFSYLLSLHLSGLLLFFCCPASLLSTNHRAWTRLPWPMPPFWMAAGGAGPTVPWPAQWALWLSVFLLSLLLLTRSTPQRWAN